MKHNDVLYERLSYFGYYMPLGYDKINTERTLEDLLNDTIIWIDEYREKLYMYIESCTSDIYDIKLDKYRSRLAINSLKLRDIRNEIVMMKRQGYSKLKGFMILNKAIMTIIKSAYNVYATDLFEDN
jgi:hypothetical protein